MSGITRYEYNQDCDMMMGVSDGEYVLFTDHEADVSGLRALVARRMEALRKMHKIADGTAHFQNGDNTCCHDPDEECPISMGEFITTDDVRDIEEAAALLADPSTASALAWLKEQKREAVREATDDLRPVLVRALAEYRTQGLQYDEGEDVQGDGMLLADVFTQPGAGTTAGGQREIELLADELACAISSSFNTAEAAKPEKENADA